MLKRVYRVLDRVYREGAYVGAALNAELETDKTDRAAITATVYGVLERDTTLEYYLSALCKSRPKPALRVVLKIGLFRLLFSDTPDFAAVSGTVNLVKEIGKAPQAGFVNAVLKQASTVRLPAQDPMRLSVYASKPLWWLDRVGADFPAQAREIAYAQPTTDTHVRGVSAGRKTPYGGFVDAKLAEKLGTEAVIESLGSCAVADAVGARDGERILDACAAPGGKALFMTERADCRVTACDIHPHRVELIRRYIARRGRQAQAEASVKDATAFDPAWERAFDRVLVDAPCSGSGVVWSKPDILLKVPDLDALGALQARILANCARFVRAGGTLVYATCSLFRCENDGIVGAFLSAHPEYACDTATLPVPAYPTKYGLQMLPVGAETEGYYVARLRRAADEGRL